MATWTVSVTISANQPPPSLQAQAIKDLWALVTFGNDVCGVLGVSGNKACAQFSETNGSKAVTAISQLETIGYLGLVIYYLAKGYVDLVRVNQLIKEKGRKSPQVKAALKKLWNDDLRPVLTTWLEAFPSLKLYFHVPPPRY